jgi:hypothetical protein
MTPKAPETRIPQTSEQLLEQCSPDDILGVATLKARLAHHHNSQPSVFFTKLPAELILEIGEHLLESNPFWRDKSWFSDVLPLMQTSVQLRAALRPLLPKTLTSYIRVNEERAFAHAMEQLEEWKKGWPREMRVELIINIVWSSLPSLYRGLEPSASAAIAGDLERAIYGTLLDEPLVFVRCSTVPDGIIKDIRWIFISSRGREGKILAWTWDSKYIYYLNQEEAALVWDNEKGDESD